MNKDMEFSYFLSYLVLWTFFQLAIGGINNKKYESPCPNECDLKKCPKLQFCEGEIVKDRCRCCPDCSTNIGFNSTYTQEDGACKQVKCPRFKVCMENMQGLPLCTCPNPFVCRGRRRQVCGKDGITYQSRCHMRVISCHKAKRIKMAHKGQCGMVGTQRYSNNVNYKETEFDISAKRRRNRKQMKRKNRKALQKRRRKQRKRKQRKAKRRRGHKKSENERKDEAKTVVEKQQG